MNKKCLTCEKLFNKKPNQSVKDWNSRVKYCSKECLHKSRVGKKHTAEHNRKISDALKSIDWSWKVGVPHGHRTSNGGGWKLTEEQKKAISLRFRGKPKPNQSGSKCSFWKGGVTPINRAIRKSLQYKEWRTAVFIRDNRECVWCGSGKQIEADHIEPFSLFPELRFNMDNGRTLCHDCHKTTPTYAGKMRTYKRSEEFTVKE